MSARVILIGLPIEMAVAGAGLSTSRISIPSIGGGAGSLAGSGVPSGSAARSFWSVSIRPGGYPPATPTSTFPRRYRWR